MNFILDTYKDLLTINELCEILRIGKNTAYNLLRSGQIKNRQINKKYFIPKTGVLEFLGFDYDKNYDTMTAVGGLPVQKEVFI